MASQYERRENGDGTYSVNTAITDADGLIPVDLRDHGMNELNPLVTRGYSAQVQGHNAASIRDTSNVEVVVDVSKLTGEKLIAVASTLNQSSTIYAYAEGTGYTFASLGNKVIAASSTAIISSSDFPGLRGPLQKIRLRTVAAVAPTTGSFSSFVEGVQA